MMSIKDPEYVLPQVQATLFIKKFENSANTPILIRGVDLHTYEKLDCVVKLKAVARMAEPAASMREFLACFIAMELQIPVAAPVLVEITHQFAGAIPDATLRTQAERSLGYNFATSYYTGYQMPAHTPLIPVLLPFAQRLFAFDMFIQNVDRNYEKPNMLTNGKEIIAIDHETAFSFVYTLGKIAIWELPEESKLWIRRHFLLQHIRGHDFDFDAFSDNFAKLDTRFWDKAWEVMPPEWRLDQFHRIRERLDSFIEQRGHFIRELKQIMS